MPFCWGGGGLKIGPTFTFFPRILNNVLVPYFSLFVPSAFLLPTTLYWINAKNTRYFPHKVVQTSSLFDNNGLKVTFNTRQYRSVWNYWHYRKPMRNLLETYRRLHWESDTYTHHYLDWRPKWLIRVEACLQKDVSVYDKACLWWVSGRYRPTSLLNVEEYERE